MSNVELLCTTDDPLDDLEYHQKMAKQDLGFKVYPTFRPDKILNIAHQDFLLYVTKLLKITNLTETNFTSFLNGVNERLVFFHINGCRLSDHAFENVSYVETSVEVASHIFDERLKGVELPLEKVIAYQSFIIKFLNDFYAKSEWVCQYHIGAIRNLNSKMYQILGPDTGYDAISDTSIAKGLSALLNSLEQDDILPKTIIYTLNPKDFELAVTIMQCFQSKSKGKIQFGSAWWFLDTKENMEKQLLTLASNGMLSHFVGMLTDSRSFVSYPRHEYFRRILCNLVAEITLKGEFVHDEELLSKIVSKISYYNAKEYFDF
jgi:glucuronate isomerase